MITCSHANINWQASTGFSGFKRQLVCADCGELISRELSQEELIAKLVKEIADLRRQLEETQHKLLLVRSEYKLSLVEENARLRQQIIYPEAQPQGLTAECFTGNCHHTRKENKK